MFLILRFYTFKSQLIGIIFKIVAGTTILVYIFFTIYISIIAYIHSIVFIAPLTRIILIIPIAT